MMLQKIQVGPFQVKCYLYFDEASSDTVIIDPGAEDDRIIEQITEANLEPRAILLTHGHGDHIAAVAAIKDKYKIPLYIGRGEEELLANPSANVSALFANPIVAPSADHLLDDEQMVSAGNISLKVLSTPGHSPGGVCYLDETQGFLFCGDTLFYGSVGRTDFPGCSHERLIASINDKIMKLPDNIVCYPGHGPETTVGSERTNNPFLRGDYFV